MAEQVWTDDPITAGATRISKKATHFTELQDAINAWETAYGITNTVWADAPAAQVKIKTTAITEMQDALDALYQLTDSDDFVFTVPIITSTPIPAHINELREDMNFMQDERCHVCDTCDTYAHSCTCDESCDTDACDQCNASCFGYSACTCNAVCYPNEKAFCTTCNGVCYGYVACTCNSTCNVDACAQCDAVCYEDVTTCVACFAAGYRYPWT